MRFTNHLLFGVVFFILFYFILRPDISSLIPCAIALLLGSILPDLDHPFSHIRKFFRVIAFIIIAAFTFVFLSMQPVQGFVQEQCLKYGCSSYLVAVQAILAAVMSFIIVMILDLFIPFHRGPLHGIAAAAGYAIICGIIAVKLSSDFFIVTVAGFIGYLSHIIPDALFAD